MNKLFVNGQEIDVFKENHNGLEENTYAFDLPGFVLIEKKSTDVWVGDLVESDCDELENIIPIDMSKYIGKKVKVYIKSIGKASKE